MTAAADLHGPLLEQTGAFRGNALLLTGPARVGKLDVARAVAAQHNCTGQRGSAPQGENRLKGSDETALHPGP